MGLAREVRNLTALERQVLNDRLGRVLIVKVDGRKRDARLCARARRRFYFLRKDARDFAQGDRIGNFAEIRLDEVGF